MPKLKANTIWPTSEEDVLITAAAIRDPDAIPFSDAEWALAEHVIRRGRPLTGEAKVAISLRLPSSTLARWKATGPGWQTRMAQYLSEAAIQKRG